MHANREFFIYVEIDEEEKKSETTDKDNNNNKERNVVYMNE